ncbi:MAG: hypothetical protein KJZ75_07710 [Hyphomonadaceae bacterium]|nr:hypothetical protein [Hyphomonadaceae bacterium]GIK48464.1 MAG: hypothetical protein BroJett013_11610 [Alphaproteobacteria bacterium]
MSQADLATATAEQPRRAGLAANLVAAPFIYAVLAPLMALDAFVSLYQAICFRLWSIPQVRRAPHMRFDRAKLPYLNALQRLNCRYCSYANGVLAYAMEIAAKTEQYWCPIQHETDPDTPHSRYKAFIAYGDSHDLKRRWSELRAKLEREDD